jgi:hypothetical protein
MTMLTFVVTIILGERKWKKVKDSSAGEPMETP